MRAKSDDLFAGVALRYIQKNQFNIEKTVIKFFYNSHELKITSGKTLAEHRIQGNARIDVLLDSIISFGIIFILNGQQVAIPAHSDDLFAEVALKYVQIVGLNLDNLKFFFNSKLLEPISGKTIKDYGIKTCKRLM